MVTIRTARKEDLLQIQQVVKSAFGQAEGELIARMILEILLDTNAEPVYCLVAVIDDEIVGVIGFTPFSTIGNNPYTGYILAPLAVAVGHQSKGIGSDLIHHGLAQLKKKKINVVLVYGDVNYYRRFGFNEDTSRLFIPSYTLEYEEGWLGQVLTETYLPERPQKIACHKALADESLW